MMAVLMLVFMFIAVISARVVISDPIKQGGPEEVAHKCNEIYYDLKARFGKDFESWEAELFNDLTIRFHNPDILFPSGSDEIKSGFKDILDIFFPRYIESLIPYREDIREIRIEGHTSSEFETAKTKDDAYFLNMNLSHKRTMAILKYVLDLSEMYEYKEWAKPLITANGLSSSRLIYYKGTNKEDKRRSRRVEFRILAASCQKAGVYDNENR